ncbi:hypothetical protein PAHAL_4G351900 [Panicum hallii]|uniref:Uncharacterized protein n=1 Tax=Panicum hallii TaxID=206008 RepID=A0A2T8JF44_9POAL|nr:hypothetical protein PAHAL_4G351900 [Panicum hallii]
MFFARPRWRLHRAPRHHAHRRHRHRHRRAGQECSYHLWSLSPISSTHLLGNAILVGAILTIR